MRRRICRLHTQVCRDSRESDFRTSNGVGKQSKKASAAMNPFEFHFYISKAQMQWTLIYNGVPYLRHRRYSDTNKKYASPIQDPFVFNSKPNKRALANNPSFEHMSQLELWLLIDEAWHASNPPEQIRAGLFGEPKS